MAPRSTRSLPTRKAKGAAGSGGTPPVTTTRITRQRSVIANSSQPDETPYSRSFDSISASGQPSRRLLKEVAIPAMAPSKRRASSRTQPDLSITSSRSSESSASGTRDTSVDYETPATSAAPTPAELPLGRGKNASIESVAGPSVKRKRPARFFAHDDDAMDTSADAQLARALQEEEYGGGMKRAKTATKTGTRSRKLNGYQESDDDGETEDALSESIANSTSDLDSLSDLDSPSSVDVAMSFKGKGKAPQRGRGPKYLVTNSYRPPPSRMTTRKRRPDLPLESDETDLTSLNNDFSDYSEHDSSGAVVALLSDSEDDVSLASLDGNSGPSTISGQAAAGTAPRRARAFTSRMEEFRERRRLRKMRERAKLERAHPGIRTMWQDLEATPVIAREKAEQPESITRTLKSFQLEGLNWMKKQEKTIYKGGLLGDEMGMGKTIQAVSLIMSDFPAKQPTLVVVPPVALMQWSNEIREYTDGKLKVLIFHGAKSKTFSVADLKTYNVIMISYQSLESLYRKETKGWTRGDDIVKEDSPIHAITFHRLILDEAHSIKQRTTGVAKACFALKGQYKWCLSGTPVQNRIGEFFSLLRFLEVRPFADYFCKSCPCSQLHWSLDDDHRCAHCRHSGAEHVSVFNQEILNPITQTESDSLREAALDKLRLITDRIMLRRVKRDHTASMELPPKEIVLHNEFFGEIERDFSSSIMTNTTRQFDTYVSRGVMLNNYANIFGLIMQMRQVADHPDLLLKKHSEGGQNVLVCNICDEPAEEAIRSRCKHEFCRSCIKSFVQSCEGAGGTPDCPRCHIPLSIDFDQPDIEQDEEMVKKNSIINRIKMQNWTSSTKIEMLVYDLYKLRSKKQTLKSIVFSQFTSMLQLIEWRLRRAGFNTVMLDGSMTPIQRQRSIEYFMKNTDVEVFLVSLKAGGVALNLTEASRVFIVDPWWNPAAEWQSADRCHRIGQRRPCVITRLCIEDSVESRMVMLQEKKANMINGTINNDKVSMDKLTPEDLQFLFRGS